ncbi:hypothetical protein [Streptomyces atratus]|uniref:hypothetical protein n=1 Tax=Streptomyces atratus TaxID=1893 RepID=UPI002257CF03|nr:hypothetical protein [Streptomyces atratus]MCX5338515.1 hypothetical protein [Streptomyces atratus]
MVVRRGKKELATSGSGASYRVMDSVPINCGNIHTSNAKVWITGGVLIAPVRSEPRTVANSPGNLLGM